MSAWLLIVVVSVITPYEGGASMSLQNISFAHEELCKTAAVKITRDIHYVYDRGPAIPAAMVISKATCINVSEK